jgi:hypothetical protein
VRQFDVHCLFYFAFVCKSGSFHVHIYIIL